VLHRKTPSLNIILETSNQTTKFSDIHVTFLPHFYVTDSFT
jgi:hypothetical protein